MFDQIPATVLVTVVNASLMTLVLVSAGYDRRAYVWLAAVILAGGLRLALWRGYRRHSGAPGRIQRWAIAGVCAAAASGLLWGVGAVLLLPGSETYQLFWVFLIGGMCAGAAALYAAHQPTALAFILPAALPIAIQFAVQGLERETVAAAMILVFLVALSVTGRRASRQFGDMIRLQIVLAERTASLDASHGLLRQEMAEHRTTEATLRQAQKMEAMGQLTGGIAHDFNNLLTVVLGSLELLRNRLPAEDARAVRLLDNAVLGAERGATLTQRLLAFGRRQALNPQVVDVVALVRGMSDLLHSSLGAAVRTETRFPMVLAPAHVDANQLELALLNLAVNARDAMPQGGRLTIAAREAQVGPGERAGLSIGSYVVLGVSDTGEGMSAATLAQAMDPFFTTKGIGKGTGLGLSMVHGLAVQSGGQLVIRSNLGEGTTVELWLPRAEAPSAPTIEVLEAVPASTGVSRTILLVDDDPLVLTSTAAMLDDLGHGAIEAGSAAQALEILRAGAAVDLVITDHSMPIMTGLQLAEELGRRWPGLPVLLATGYAETRATGPASPAYLAKPFGRDALAQAIAACLAGEEPPRGANVVPFAR